MKRFLTSVALIGGAFAAGALVAWPASAQEKLTIAVVPKNLNNPFFDQAKLGCDKAVEEIGADKVECMFTGPPEHGGGEEQVQIVADLVAKGVDGIAVAPANAAAMAAALRDAQAAGIPVLTWDSDVLPEDKGLRLAYVGTHNYDIGVNLAKLAQEIKPDGGTICIQSGGAAAANHNERMQGIRDTLAGVERGEPPGERLTGQNGWTEVEGCPLYTNDDFPLSVQQLEDTLGKYPDLDAFIPTGGFPSRWSSPIRCRCRSISSKRACRPARSASGPSRWATSRSSP
jgi:ribose transport system substrate-binding protein